MTGGWFSQTGLARLHDVMVGHVERGVMPGCITLVARNGRAHVDVIGTRIFDDAQPLRRDDIFRITSMTKPITAAAVMTLVDDRTLHLDASVDDLLRNCPAAACCAASTPTSMTPCPPNARSPSRT